MLHIIEMQWFNTQAIKLFLVRSHLYNILICGATYTTEGITIFSGKIISKELTAWIYIKSVYQEP